VPLVSVTSIANEPSRTFEICVAAWSTDALTGATTNAVDSAWAPAPAAPELRVTDAERPDGDVTTTIVLEPLLGSGWIT